MCHRPHLSTTIVVLLICLTSLQALPIALFNYIPLGNKVVFRADLSLGSPRSYTWDFGDGSGPITTQESSITYYFPIAKFWWVKLTITDRYNKQSSVTNLVLSPYNAEPTCSFSIKSVQNDDIVLDASKSKDNDGTITQYRWILGDGSDVISIDSPTLPYSYSKGGYYTISLTTVDNSKAVSSLCSTKVFVNHPPVATFTWSDENGHFITLDGSHSEDPDGFIQFYQWNYGDGQQSNRSNVSKSDHLFVLSGYYDVSLTVTDNLGNSTLASQKVLVDIPPRPHYKIEYNFDDLLVLSASELTWVDNNSHLVSLLWDWNDGETTLSSQPSAKVSHNYTTGAFYNVSMLVTDNYGKQGFFSEIVLVNAIPKVFFDAVEISNDTITLKNLAVDLDGNITHWVWDFGDENITELSDNLHIIEHTYILGGTYNICLSVRDNLSAENKSCKSFFLNRAPTARFKIVENENDTLIVMDDNSIDYDGHLTQFLWNWGDGNLSTHGFQASHNYTWGGYYNVSLTVTDNLEFEDTVTQLIRVNSKPISAFAILHTVNNTITIDPSLSFDVDGVIVEYNWDFGDNKNMTTTDDTVFTHRYRFGGNYTLTLTVTDNMNDTTSFYLDIFVDIPPFASFEVISVIENWVIVCAKPHLSSRSNTRDIDGYLTSLIWNFGEQTSSNVTNVTSTTQLHQYKVGGNYTVSLFAKDNNNMYSQIAQRSVFVNSAPIPHFVLQEYDDGVLILNSSTSSDRDGKVMLNCWNMGDNSTINCTNSTVHTYYYSRAGTYNVSLTVIDNLNTSSSSAFSLIVTTNIPPFASFEISDVQPLGVLSFESNNKTSFDVDGFLVKYVWNFGDNTSLITTYNDELTNISKVSHQYKSSGFYNVTLTVVDNLGSSRCLTIPALAQVLDPQKYTPSSLDPSSDDFMKQTDLTTQSYSPNQSPIPNIQFFVQNFSTVGLSAQGSKDADGKVISYFWNLGDGTTSTEPILTHTYPSGGPVNISLTIVDDQGASATMLKVITLNYIPRASFTFKILSSLSVNFNPSSSFDLDGQIVKYEWNFGNGKISTTTTQTAFTHNFVKAGIFTITLVVTDNKGAKNLFIQNINLAEESVTNTTLITQNLPRIALFQNVKTLQYLTLDYDPYTKTGIYSFQEDNLLHYDNLTNHTINPYFALSKNYLTNGYFIMNKENGLYLSINQVQNFEITLQGANTTSFLISSYQNYYLISDPISRHYVSVMNNSLQLINEFSTEDSLWNLITPQFPASQRLPLS